MLGKPKDRICAAPECENIVTQYRSTDKYCSPRCAMLGGMNKAKLRKKVHYRSVAYKEPTRRTRMKQEAKIRDGYRCMMRFIEHHECDNRREAHHILYLSEGGVDELWNLVTLCGYAHHKIAHASKQWQLPLIKLVNGTGWFAEIDQSDLSPTVAQKMNYLGILDKELI